MGARSTNPTQSALMTFSVVELMLQYAAGAVDQICSFMGGGWVATGLLNGGFKYHAFE